jgi:hypothetical protein
MQITIDIPRRVVKDMARFQNVNPGLVLSDIKMLSIREILKAYQDVPAAYDWGQEAIVQFAEDHPEYVKAVLKDKNER